MKLTKIYCGSNNETGELELGKIRKIMTLEGNCSYTIIEAEGYDSKISEHTAIIEIYGEYNTGILIELKAQLKQNSLLVAESYQEVKTI